jgi:anti-sigma28 factor (negative regulator of flagellin synthesis)
MDDPHTNSRFPKDRTSPTGAGPEQENPSSARNGQEPLSQPLPIDPIDLTDPQALYDLIQREAKQIPDVRKDRIKRIRDALESREYHISSDLLADRIIQDIFLDESSTQD